METKIINENEIWIKHIEKADLDKWYHIVFSDGEVYVNGKEVELAK